jgi:hypothetical protein
MKDDYHLCMNKPEEYRKKVDSISDLFGLRGRDKLKNDNCAVYVCGNYSKAPVVTFGLNPGWSATNNPAEEVEARKSWQHYLDLYQNFFQFFSSHKFESPYYKSLWLLLRGLLHDTETIQKLSKWELFSSYLANMELIPYHSSGISSLANRLSEQQLEYLTTRFEKNMDFISKFDPKLFIFNGKAWYTLLIKHQRIRDYRTARVSEKFDLYFFRICDIPCVLFNRFFSRHFWKITDYDRRVTIPNIINKRYGNLVQPK